MDVFERFKMLTIGCQDEEQELKNYCLEIEHHIHQMETHCKQVNVCIASMMSVLEDEDYEDSEGEIRELPVEDYKLIREKYGEEVANRMYYDVKLRKVPLQFVQRYLCKIREEEKIRRI